MKVVKKAIIISSLFLGVNSVNSSFAYWPTGGSNNNNTANIDTSVIIGDFPHNESVDVEYGTSISLKRGDIISVKGVKYVAIKDIDNYYVSAAISSSKWDYINTVESKNYNSSTNYYDEWSKPFNYVTQSGATDIAQPISANATNMSPANSNPYGAYMIDMGDYSYDYNPNMPYIAPGFVVKENGKYYYNKVPVWTNQGPSMTENWGSGNPWGKIAVYSSGTTYEKGDYVVENDIVYVVTKKSKKSPSADAKSYRQFMIKTFITVNNQKELVKKHIPGSTHLAGEYVVTGYDICGRAVIYYYSKDSDKAPTDNGSGAVRVYDPLSGIKNEINVGQN